MINWFHYPAYKKCPKHLVDIMDVFRNYELEISSTEERTRKLKSNDILGIVSSGLSEIGCIVERSDSVIKKIRRPILFGLNGVASVQYDVDAYQESTKTIIEVEAGRATENNQWLKDLLEAFLIYDAEYLVIAVKNEYVQSKKTKRDFDTVCEFLDAIYNSDRIQVPLKGILIIGY